MKRWTAKRRSALIIAVRRGKTSVEEAVRWFGLTVAEIEQWQKRFLAAAENALRPRPRDEDGLKDQQIKQLQRKVGELVKDMDIMKEEMKLRPFDEGTSDE